MSTICSRGIIMNNNKKVIIRFVVEVAVSLIIGTIIKLMIFD